MSRFHLLPIVLLAATAACGVSELDFVEDYTLKVCEHDLECGDDAQQRFDGVLSVDDCVDQTKPSVYTWGNGCRFRGGQATQCLADLETLTCPGSGGLAPIPSSCDQVYVNCGEVTDTGGDDGGEDTGSGGDTDTGNGGDTDPGGDTDA